MTHDGQVTETINSLRRRDPQGAFAILEQLQHGVTGQPISSCEMVRVVANCPKKCRYLLFQSTEPLPDHGGVHWCSEEDLALWGTGVPSISRGRIPEAEGFRWVAAVHSKPGSR